MTLAGDGSNAQTGLVGSLRNFQMFKVTVSDELLRNSAYVYLHPYRDLLMQVVL